MRRASSQTRLSSMQASGSFLDIAFISFSTRYTRQNYFWVRLDSRSITGLCGEACALERSDAPIRIGAQLGREGVQGLERALDRSAVGGGLRSQEANPRQRDIEGAKPPASSSVDELTRLREERAGSRAITGGQLRVCERREDARLVPQRGASTASERERPLEHTRGRGEVAVRELRSAEKRRGLHPREHAFALFRELDGTAAVGERAEQMTPQAQHLAQECVRSVEGLECALTLLGEECLQGGLSLGRAPEVCARQRPPDAAQARGGGTPDRLPQSGNLRDLGQSPLGGRTSGSEAADRKLCVGQHRAHLELEHCVGSFGELRSALRACEVLPHVAREPAQASVGREQERVACLVLKSLGDRARLVEEAPGLTLLDSGDAADFEQRDARGELEHQGLAGLRNGGEERGDPTAVSHPIRRVTACDASARLLVPTSRLEVLAGLIEVMGEERGVRRNFR